MYSGFNKILLYCFSIVVVFTTGSYGSQRPPEDSSDSDGKPSAVRGRVAVLLRPPSTLAIPEVRPRRVTSAPSRPNSSVTNSLGDGWPTQARHLTGRPPRAPAGIGAAETAVTVRFLGFYNAPPARPQSRTPNFVEEIGASSDEDASCSLGNDWAILTGRPPRAPVPSDERVWEVPSAMSGSRCMPHSRAPDFVEEIGASSSNTTILLDELRSDNSQVSRQSSGVMTYPFQSSRQSSAASSALPSPPTPHHYLMDRGWLLPPLPKPSAWSRVAEKRETVVKIPSSTSAYSDGSQTSRSLSEESPAVEETVSLSGAESRDLREDNIRRLRELKGVIENEEWRRIMGEEEVRRLKAEADAIEERMRTEEEEVRLRRMREREVTVRQGLQTSGQDLPTMVSPLQGTRRAPPPSTSSVVFHNVDSGLERQLSAALLSSRVRALFKESPRGHQNSADASSSGGAAGSSQSRDPVWGRIGEDEEWLERQLSAALLSSRVRELFKESPRGHQNSAILVRSLDSNVQVTVDMEDDTLRTSGVVMPALALGSPKSHESPQREWFTPRLIVVDTAPRDQEAHQNASLPSPRTLQARRQARAQQASRGGGDGPDRSSPYSYRPRRDRTGHAVRGGSPVSFE